MREVIKMDLQRLGEAIESGQNGTVVYVRYVDDMGCIGRYRFVLDDWMAITPRKLNSGFNA